MAEWTDRCPTCGEAFVTYEVSDGADRYEASVTCRRGHEFQVASENATFRTGSGGVAVRAKLTAGEA